MTTPDITVAITAHDESLVAGPSVRSAELAIAAAEKAGFTVERLIGLDRPTDACRRFFSQDLFSAWRIEEMDFGDPYPTRNALIRSATGRWIAFLDADDLFSENWLVLAARRLAEAEAAGERVVAHPELNWIFEGADMVFMKPGQDDPLFTPHYFYFGNYYDMLCMAPRVAGLETPYGHRDLAKGLGYQDWQWNIETMSLGWKHVSIKDTILFKRRRAGSVSEQNRSRQSVVRRTEPMAIDKVRSLGRSDGRPD